MEEAKLRQLRGAGARPGRGDGDGGGGDGGSGGDEDDPQAQQQQQRAKESLLVSTARARAAAPEQTVEEKVVAEEADIMRHLQQKQALKAVQELAAGVTYTKSMATGWKPPLAARRMSARKQQRIREAFHIAIDGHNVPPPLTTFKDMKLPPPILDHLAAKGIRKPTPIQIQAMPAALSGRDIIGIAFTGSGKTLVFSVPMLMIALQEEMRLPLVTGEGPVVRLVLALLFFCGRGGGRCGTHAYLCIGPTLCANHITSHTQPQHTSHLTQTTTHITTIETRASSSARAASSPARRTRS
jgi:ATP-dependent RNA helicase DDX41